MTHHQNKITLRSALQTVAFLLLFVLLFVQAQNVFQDKAGRVSYAAASQEPYGTVDVAFMGTSHMDCALYPMELYQAYGITSVNQAQSAQTIPLTYYAVKEVIELQAPKLIVCDLYYLFRNESASSDGFMHQTIDNMSSFGLKVQCVTDLYPIDRWSEFLLPFTFYHSRWDSLKKSDFTAAAQCTTKGSIQEFSRDYSGEDPTFSLVSSTEKLEPPPTPLAYLQKIVDLCRETNTELLFVVLPYCAWGEEQDRNLADDQRYYHWMTDWCAERNVAYLNMFEHLEELSFEMKADMRDWHHFNHFGGVKVTQWLGDYLSKHYALDDRRGDPTYQSWDESLEAYHAYVEKGTTASE